MMRLIAKIVSYRSIWIHDDDDGNDDDHDHDNDDDDDDDDCNNNNICFVENYYDPGSRAMSLDIIDISGHIKSSLDAFNLISVNSI